MNRKVFSTLGIASLLGITSLLGFAAACSSAGPEDPHATSAEPGVTPENIVPRPIPTTGCCVYADGSGCTAGVSKSSCTEGTWNLGSCPKTCPE